jgi:hypothetical protein
VNQAGQGAPFQCKHTLDGTCSWGPSRCRYVHGVDFHANGVDLEAHKGAIRGLASDANCLYTFGEDGIIKTYSWTPGRGGGRGGRGRPSSDGLHGARRWHVDAGMVGMSPLFPTLFPRHGHHGLQGAKRWGSREFFHHLRPHPRLLFLRLSAALHAGPELGDQLGGPGANVFQQRLHRFDRLGRLPLH